MTHTGLYVPMITPFDVRGEIALPALDDLARHTLETGATGLVALGTTAEPSSLNPDETAAVLTVLRAACRDHHAPLIIGANDTTAIQARTATGTPDGILSLVPPFIRPGPAGVLAHFQTLAATAPAPVLIYHVPHRTGQELRATTIRQLAALPGIAGIKLALGSIDTTTIDLMADLPPHFTVLAGDDTFASPLLALGAHGGILASAHLATRSYADLIQAWRTGDATRGRALGHRLSTLSTALLAEPNPTVIKAVLHAQGRIPTPHVRPPLTPATTATVRTALTHLHTTAPQNPPENVAAGR